MPLERRKFSTTKDAEDAKHGTEPDGKESDHRLLIAMCVRRAIPFLLVFCWVATAGKAYNLFLVGDGTEPSEKGTSTSSLSPLNAEDNRADGFMVLGMHRSGTSMLTGLLHLGAGYTVGKFYAKGKENPKGFFERFDVVRQNDLFLKNQGMAWSKIDRHYDFQKSLDDLASKAIEKAFANKANLFFEAPESMPWVQKDPRMCITLKTWLKLMKKKPAILHTYRNPLEVALSLRKRSKGFSLERGLELWTKYNAYAIRNSKGLCRVTTSNAKILADPLNEIQRISDELTSECGVPAPEGRISQEMVDKFIEPNFQHHKQDKAIKGEDQVLEKMNDGECVIYILDSLTKEAQGTPREHKLYLEAMRIYCDLESGKAYEDDYEWSVP